MFGSTVIVSGAIGDSVAAIAADDDASCGSSESIFPPPDTGNVVHNVIFVMSLSEIVVLRLLIQPLFTVGGLCINSGWWCSGTAPMCDDVSWTCWYHKLLSVNSLHLNSKNLRIPCPAFPTGESSSLNTSQLLNI